MRCFKVLCLALAGVAWLVGPKGPGFDLLSGHLPGLQVLSAVGACTGGHMDVSLPLPPSFASSPMSMSTSSGEQKKCFE